MNPWGNTKIGPKDLNDYIIHAKLEPYSIESEICSTQNEILTVIENYYKLSAQLKEDSDFDKVGDFIDASKLLQKSNTLKALADSFEMVNKNCEIFIKKAKETRPGNQINIKQEFQTDFFKVLAIVKDTDLLEIASHAGRVHDRTKSDLNSSLSASLSQEGEVILDTVKKSLSFLEKIKNKYQ